MTIKVDVTPREFTISRIGHRNENLYSFSEEEARTLLFSLIVHLGMDVVESVIAQIRLSNGQQGRHVW